MADKPPKLWKVIQKYVPYSKRAETIIPSIAEAAHTRANNRTVPVTGPNFLCSFRME